MQWHGVKNLLMHAEIMSKTSVLMAYVSMMALMGARSKIESKDMEILCSQQERTFLSVVTQL
jgi:hypothetical protein